MQIARAGPEIQ